MIFIDYSLKSSVFSKIRITFLGYPSEAEAVVSLLPPGTKDPDINDWYSYWCDVSDIGIDHQHNVLYFTNETGLYKLSLSEPDAQIIIVNGTAVGGGLIINSKVNQVVWGAMAGPYSIDTIIMTNDLTTGEVISSYPTNDRWQFPLSMELDDQTGMPYYLAAEANEFAQPSWSVYRCEDTQCKNQTVLYSTSVQISSVECMVGLQLNSATRTFYSLYQCGEEGIWLQSGGI